MKYPLTDTAKAEARRLVDEWDKGILNQTFDLINFTAGADPKVQFKFGIGGNNQRSRPPEIDIIRQLERYGLVHVVVLETNDPRKHIEITLLQELRNAVASDFEVSEYFLTMNAVGNIIINSQTGPIQGTGYTGGDVHQSIEQVADGLAQALGLEILESQKDLRDAINALGSATRANQKAASRNVVAQLGRSLQHTANTAKILSVLVSYGPALLDLVGG